MQKNQKKVIIVGGGTAGVTIAKHIQNHFDVLVVEKSKYKKYPYLYGIPLLIGFLFRKKKMKHITKSSFTLQDGREIPFFESNLWGGASVMNGCVHVFGFKTKWQQVLRKFNLSYDSLITSYNNLYSFDQKDKNKITLMCAHQNIIDTDFINTLKIRNIEPDDMSFSEKEACGPIQNTVRTRFRTSVLNLVKARKFKRCMDEEVEKILFDENFKVIGVKTTKEIREADFVILSAGVVGSNKILLKEKIEQANNVLSNSIGTKVKDHTNIRVNVLANKEFGSLNEISNSLLKKLSLAFKHLSGIPTVMRGTGATSAAYLDLDKNGEIDTRIQILQFAETGRHGSSGSLFGSENPSFSISITAIHPESEGEITLKGNKTVVDPRFLSSQSDVEILKLALKYCLDLLKTHPLSSHVLEIVDEELIKSNPESYIRNTMFSGHHLIGGLQNAVDQNFEVQNVKGLYVCDASIFNDFVASNIHSSVVLMADLFAEKFINNLADSK